jgi:hypothetical protein
VQPDAIVDAEGYSSGVAWDLEEKVERTREKRSTAGSKLLDVLSRWLDLTDQRRYAISLHGEVVEMVSP